MDIRFVKDFLIKVGELNQLGVRTFNNEHKRVTVRVVETYLSTTEAPSDDEVRMIVHNLKEMIGQHKKNLKKKGG